jgi:hypothetical protein
MLSQDFYCCGLLIADIVGILEGEPSRHISIPERASSVHELICLKLFSHVIDKLAEQWRARASQKSFSDS